MGFDVVFDVDLDVGLGVGFKVGFDVDLEEGVDVNLGVLVTGMPGKILRRKQSKNKRMTVDKKYLWFS